MSGVKRLFLKNERTNVEKRRRRRVLGVESDTVKSRESQNFSHTETNDPNSPYDFIV